MPVSNRHILRISIGLISVAIIVAVSVAIVLIVRASDNSKEKSTSNENQQSQSFFPPTNPPNFFSSVETKAPTAVPSLRASVSTMSPTSMPSSLPTVRLTEKPIEPLTLVTTGSPTRSPTSLSPTTIKPSSSPTNIPTDAMTSPPSIRPTTLLPSLTPSRVQTVVPTVAPTSTPITISNSSCAAYPACAGVAVLGNCCPTSTGTFLSCCPASGSDLSPSAAPMDTTFAPIPVTASPTPPKSGFPVIDPSFRFHLKLHWESDYCWQEVCDEVQWCVECTTCYDGVTDENLETADGCYDDDNNDPTCYEGDVLWVQNCNGWEGSSGNSVFNVLQSSSYDQIRVDGTNLCLSRPKPRRVDIQTCNASDINQQFIKMDVTKPFLIQYARNETSNYCMTQLHHPKKYELYFLESCENAINTNTAYWDALPA